MGRRRGQARLDAAHNERFTAWFNGRPGVVRDARGWPDLLRSAGLEQVASRNVLLDLPAPLRADAREVVLAELAARFGRAQAFLDEDDIAAWGSLLDRTSPAWLGHHGDLALLTAWTVHMERSEEIMAEDRQTEIRGAFDAAAADFTALGRYLWEPIGTAAVTVAAPRPGERILDACCGTGASAIPAARLVGQDGLVDAVDMSAPMIDELRRLSADLPQLRAHQADATTWAAESYDVVQSALGIFFFPDMTTGTDHLISLARPGGRAVFTIWRGESMVAAGRRLGRAIAEATNAPVPAPRPPHLIDRINQADAYAIWLTERGLADVGVTVNEMTLTMTPEVAWLVVIGSGFRGALAKVPANALDTVRELYLASLRDEGLTEPDATTLIGSGRRVT